jgi:MarR family transcriptional regulator, organic hydroperoxide resistance regulator
MAPLTRRPPINEAWALLGELMRDHLRPRYLGLAADLELSPPQLQAVQRLDPEEPLPMNRLAGLLHCDNSNVTGIVDRLEARGLVERRVAPHDRRVKQLVLTDEGQAVRRRIAEAMETPPEPLQRLTPAEARELRDLLRKALAG